MDDELRERLDKIELKVDAAFASAEKTRKILVWTGIVAIVVTVLPLIGLFFAIPSFVSTYSDYSQLLQ